MHCILRLAARIRAFNMQARAASVSSDIAQMSSCSLAWCARSEKLLISSLVHLEDPMHTTGLLAQCAEAILSYRSKSEHEAMRAGAGQLSEHVMKTVTLEEGLYNARLGRW